MNIFTERISVRAAVVILAIGFAVPILINPRMKKAPSAMTFTTNWIGHPVISDNDHYTPSQGWLPDVQIGLRNDGVVVWRTVKKSP